MGGGVQKYSTSPRKLREPSTQVAKHLRKVYPPKGSRLASIVGCVGCCCMLKKDKYEDDGVTCSDTGDACMCWFCEP